MKAVARLGRPAEPAGAAQRYSLGLKVTAEMKNLIDQEARRSGRTQSQVTELLLEKAITYERVVSGLNTTLEQIQRGHLEAALRADGYRAVHSPYGDIWLPRDYPLGQRSGFKPWDEGEVEQSAAAREAAGISEEEIERRNQAQLEKAENLPRWSATDALDRLSEIEESATAPKKDDPA
jgi:hypothetical protein